MVKQISRVICSIGFGLAPVSPNPSIVEICAIGHMIYLSTHVPINIQLRGGFRNTTNNSKNLGQYFPDSGTSTGPITASYPPPPRCGAHTTEYQHPQSAHETGTCI